MAVLLLDVVDHLVAPLLAEIDVEVRHRHALGIEEALEQQAEAQRIEIGDGQRPGDDRAGARAAARADRNALRLRPLDEVGDDQEVAGEAHLDDDVELEVEPLAVGLRRRAPGAIAGRLRQPPRRGRRCACVAQLVARRRARPLGAKRGRIGLRACGHEGAAPRDLDQRVVDRLGQVGEQCPHLRGAT